MEIDKKIITCDCINSSCVYFSSCDMLPTEINIIDENSKTIMFVGMGAGKVESAKKMPWVGPAGKYLRSIIKSMWQENILFNIALTNNVRFHPLYTSGKDRPPTDNEIKTCIPILYRDIKSIKPHAIMTMGINATNSLDSNTIGKSMSILCGKRIERDSLIIVPCYHPSFLTRTYGSFKKEENNEYDTKVINAIKSVL